VPEMSNAGTLADHLARYAAGKRGSPDTLHKSGSRKSIASPSIVVDASSRIWAIRLGDAYEAQSIAGSSS